MATIDDVRDLGSSLERSYEVLIRDRVKFRVGADRLRGVLPGRDRGHGLRVPQLERAALVAGEPREVRLPSAVR